MALNLSTLPAYTKQLVAPLQSAAIFTAKTQQMILDGGLVLTGVKGSQAIPFMSTDAALQADACGFNASGTTNVTQRTIVPGKIKVEEEICPKDFEQYFTAEALRAGSTYEDFGNAEFQAKYLELKNKRIAEALEVAVWKGDTASGNAQLNKFDGLQKIINAAAGVVDANTAPFFTGAPATTVTQANIISILEAIYKAIPAELLDKTDVKIFAGTDAYRLAILAYRALNLFNYNLNADEQMKFVIPGTNVELVAVNGLNASNDFYAMQVANMVIGVDVTNEENDYKLFYFEANNVIRFRAAFKLGVNIINPTEIVKFVVA